MGWWDWNIANDTAYISPKYCELSGYDKNEIQSAFDFFKNIVHPDDFPTVAETMEKHLHGQSEYSIVEYRMIKKSGGYVWIYGVGKVVERDEKGAPVRMAGVVTDLTERKQAELDLQETNDILQARLTEIQTLQAALREQAIRDSLTGLYNRHYLEETLKREYARAVREGYSISVVILDLDCLKKINDVYGHLTGGDKAIQILGEQLKANCRAEDVACRYGGDEFFVILHDTSAQKAFERAEQWRKSVAKIKIECNDATFGVTFSAGVASFPADGNSVEEILLAADQALYQAKDAGRNCVRRFGGEGFKVES
jgi:diguanylate cyclase (GGDEF)-like protein/PAS domain S-box-containing protein